MHLVKPKLNNRRILAQEGAFLAFGLVSEIPRAGTRGIDVLTAGVTPARKGPIRAQLGGLSINERTLYPDIERAARYLTDELQTSGLVARAAGASARAPTRSRR